MIAKTGRLSNSQRTQLQLSKVQLVFGPVIFIYIYIDISIYCLPLGAVVLRLSFSLFPRLTKKGQNHGLQEYLAAPLTAPSWRGKKHHSLAEKSEVGDKFGTATFPGKAQVKVIRVRDDTSRWFLVDSFMAACLNEGNTPVFQWSFEAMPSPFIGFSSRSLSPGSWARQKSMQWRVATWRRKQETGPAQ